MRLYSEMELLRRYVNSRLEKLMSTNVTCQYFAFGGLALLASIIMFVLAAGAYFPATAERYMMFGIGAAALAVIMFGVGIWQKKGEDTAPKHEISSEDEGWSTPSS